MIRITKPGKTSQYKFVCTECGCEYIAEFIDIEVRHFGIICNCPICGEMNISKGQYKED